MSSRSGPRSRTDTRSRSSRSGADGGPRSQSRSQSRSRSRSRSTSGASGSLFYELGALSSRLQEEFGGDGAGSLGGRWGEGDRPQRRPGRWLLGASLVLLGLGIASAVLGLGLPTGSLVGVGLFVLGLAALVDAIEIVQAYEKRALTVFGADEGLLEPGLHLVPPFFSKTYQFDMRTEALDVPRQEAITEDNSPVTADAVLYIRVKDPSRAFLGVGDYRRATLMLAQTALRAVLGDMELDETLSRREEINRRIREELDAPTDPWGVEVEAVEVREVMPSPTVRSAMEEQSSAERRRRAMILESQGERRSAVLRAEGERTAAVTRAQGEKRASILEAQGDAVATVLGARAAESMGERAIIDKGFDTLTAIGSGPATTFVVPQELTSTLGRAGKYLGGGTDDGTHTPLSPLTLDAETRELLGLAGVTGDGPGPGVDIEIESPDRERQAGADVVAGDDHEAGTDTDTDAAPDRDRE